MKNKIIISSIVILVISIVFVSIYTIMMNMAYERLKNEFESVKKNRLDIITLKPNEEVSIKLDDNDVTLKLIDITKFEPCPEEEIDNPPGWGCWYPGDYEINLSVNDIVFGFDSGNNYATDIRSMNLTTDYAIYYIPNYSDDEASFLIEKDPTFDKMKNLVIGDYLIYLDHSNRVIDINTLTKDIQTWGKKYAGKGLEEIRKMIDEGRDLKKESLYN